VTLANPLNAVVSGPVAKYLNTQSTSGYSTLLLNMSKHFTIQGDLYVGANIINDTVAETFENAGIVTHTSGNIWNQGSLGKVFNDKGALWNVTKSVSSKNLVLSNNGTLTIAPKAKYSIFGFKQGKTGSLTLTISGKKKHSTLSVAPSAITSKASFAGKLRLVRAPGFKPKPKLIVKDVIAFSHGFGKFKIVMSKTNVKKTLWTAKYTPGGVNAVLVKRKLK
jgi:hypothetical protein